MGKGRKSFYSKVRNALLATNNRTDSSVITACNIAMPLANDKGTNVSFKGNVKKRTLVRDKSVNLNRTTVDRRKGN